MGFTSLEKSMPDKKSLLQAAANTTQQIIKAVVNKRVQRIKQGLSPDKSPAGDPAHLAHYTTADGLRGIIQNGNLWASGAYYLNDSSEIDYGCELFTKLLTEIIGEEGAIPSAKESVKRRGRLSNLAGLCSPSSSELTSLAFVLRKIY
jgi:hypothetical protein